jgi:hypothetical protein
MGESARPDVDAQAEAAGPNADGNGAGRAGSVSADDSVVSAAAAAAPAGEPALLLGAWLEDADLRRFIRVNRWEGVAWFERESFDELLGWAVVLDAIEAAAAAGGVAAGAGALRHALVVAIELAAAARGAGFRLDSLRDAVGA